MFSLNKSKMVQSTEYHVDKQLCIILALLKKVMKFTYGFVYMTGFMESRWITFKLCQEILIQKPKAMVRKTYCKISGDILFLFTPVSMQQSLHHLKLQTHLKNILKLISYVREANHILMKDVKWGKVSVPLHCPWDMWWTNWHFFPEYFCIPLPCLSTSVPCSYSSIHRWCYTNLASDRVFK